MILISVPMNDTYKVRTVGGSLMIVLPQRIVRQVGLSAGDDVKIAVAVGHVITVKPVKMTKGKAK